MRPWPVLMHYQLLNVSLPGPSSYTAALKCKAEFSSTLRQTSWFTFSSHENKQRTPCICSLFSLKHWHFKWREKELYLHVCKVGQSYRIDCSYIAATALWFTALRAGDILWASPSNRTLIKKTGRNEHCSTSTMLLHGNKWGVRCDTTCHGIRSLYIKINAESTMKTYRGVEV
jgi:hypothetical protein